MATARRRPPAFENELVRAALLLRCSGLSMAHGVTARYDRFQTKPGITAVLWIKRTAAGLRPAHYIKLAHFAEMWWSFPSPTKRRPSSAQSTHSSSSLKPHSRIEMQSARGLRPGVQVATGSGDVAVTEGGLNLWQCRSTVDGV